MNIGAQLCAAKHLRVIEANNVIEANTNIHEELGRNYIDFE